MYRLNIRRPLDQLGRGDFSRSDENQKLLKFNEDDTVKVGTESEWSQKERARKDREEDERLEMLMSTNEEAAAFDQDLHKELYRVYKERFSAHAIRSDKNDIKTLEIVSKTKLAPEIP